MHAALWRGVAGILLISAASLAALTRTPSDAIKHAAFFQLIYCCTALWFFPWHVCFLVIVVVVANSEVLGRATLYLSHGALLFYALPAFPDVAERYSPLFIFIPPLWIGLQPGANRLLQRLRRRGGGADAI
jgi:hypothetical protein